MGDANSMIPRGLDTGAHGAGKRAYRWVRIPVFPQRSGNRVHPLLGPAGCPVVWRTDCFFHFSMLVLFPSPVVIEKRVKFKSVPYTF